MLKNLTIKNYALIKELEIRPDPGLNIITGETGAGKSIMLGALGLLMGNRADVKALFSEDEKCVVEGTFDLSGRDLEKFFEENDIDYDTTTLIRREVAPSGKSRAFVNDQPVTLDVLKELGDQLMDIHSQHDTLLLAAQAFQLNLLDLYAQNQAVFREFSDRYTAFRKVEKAHDELVSHAAQLRREFDYNAFLLSELTALAPENIDQAELENEQQVLENAEEIKRRLAQAYDSLNYPEMPALQLLKDGVQALGSISELSPQYQALRNRLNSSLIELQDISQELEVENTRVETDDARLEIIQDTLSNLYKLQKKHQVETTAELITLKNELSAKVDTVLNLSEEIEKLENEKKAAEEAATEAAGRLSETRKAHGARLQQEITALLTELGIPNAVFEIDFREKPLSADGADTVTFRFSANKGSTPKPLKEVASGGEFSRVMLALKYILAQKTQLPTIIFDEIDTGISGEVAVKVGNLLRDMARSLQVLAITHLPQIAGKGSSHFFVYKDDAEEKTVSRMKKLSEEERVNEIAVMIGGQNPSVSAMNSARELLSL
ncbi:MAG: DNA repair protein RecN [Leadbetterella sp.]|nr:DNA repair protein RecN [Leadbetterella sp.]